MHTFNIDFSFFYNYTYIGVIVMNIGKMLGYSAAAVGILLVVLQLFRGDEKSLSALGMGFVIFTLGVSAVARQKSPKK